jgi:hypothetical protein
MTAIVIDVLKHSLIITFFVFVMMVLIDYVNVLSGGRFSLMVKKAVDGASTSQRLF